MHDKGDRPAETLQDSQWTAIADQINAGEGVGIAELIRRKERVLQNRAWMRVNGILIEDHDCTANHI